MQNYSILLLLLIVTTNPAFADWSKMAKTPIGTIYIDQINIRKSGSLVKAWELHNLEEGKGEIASFVSLKEYDCKEERVRTLSISGFSSQMGSGIPCIEETESDKWQYVRPQPGYIPSLILPLVCHDWVKITEGIYFDSASIRKNGQFVFSWVLLDDMQRDSKGALSTRMHYEYDCNGLKTRLRNMISHSDSMAYGNIVYLDFGDPPTEWEPINTSLHKHMLSIVCN